VGKIQQDKKFRPGKKVSEFNPVPALLSQKTFKNYNILIGEDEPQQRFAEQVLGLPCVFMDGVCDEDFLVDDLPKLFRVESSRVVVLSPQIKEATAFWSLSPMEKGSAAANAIVRYAATLLGMDKPDKDLVERLADTLATDGAMDDTRVSLWAAVWLLTGPEPPVVSKRWPQPWESPQLWFAVPGVSPEYRLNSLYKDLTAYTFLRDDEELVLKKAGIRVSPVKLKVLKKLNLDYSKVHDTIELLDLWRGKQTDPYVCAFRISTLWKR
jgi:hypothetical protein